MRHFSDVVQAARRRSTIIEVAAKANVAFSTVSRVLNGGYASPEVRARVEQAARELNYTPSSIARNLKTGRQGCIGVVVESSQCSWFTQVLGGIEEALAEKTVSALLGQPEPAGQLRRVGHRALDRGPPRRRADLRALHAPRGGPGDAGARGAAADGVHRARRELRGRSRLRRAQPRGGAHADRAPHQPRPPAVRVPGRPRQIGRRDRAAGRAARRAGGAGAGARGRERAVRRDLPAAGRDRVRGTMAGEAARVGADRGDVRQRHAGDRVPARRSSSTASAFPTRCRSSASTAFPRARCTGRA